MKGDKRLYLYSGLAILGAIVAYSIITKKKPTSVTNSAEEEPVEEETIITPTGDEITVEQAVLEPELQTLLNLPIEQLKLKTLNKKVYTKLDNVNPRQTPYVNNGWFVNNSVGGKITNKGTLAGIVMDVKNDSGSMASPSGRVYKWFKVKPSVEALNQIKEDSNILIGYKTDPFWLREDVITLNSK